MKGAAPTPNVWIVDDDEAVRSAFMMLMDSVGWACRSFPSGERFLESYGRDAVDCLVLDLQMPGMTGADLLELLRRRDADLPVVVITAFPENGLSNRAGAAGARAVLGKPFSADALLAEIHKIVD